MNRGANKMFNVGDLIIYSAHSICHIDDICEKTYFGDSRNYYVLHPLKDTKLTISTPVDNNKAVMLEIIQQDEAEEILNSFKQPGISWIEKSHQRFQIYSDIINSGNRKEISKIINTLMRKKYEVEMNQKKLYDRDHQLLTFTQNILFAELALSLHTTFEEIVEKVTRLITLNK